MHPIVLSPDGGDAIVRCPCGCAEVHPLSVEISRGRERTIVDADGVRLDLGGDISTRGAVVDVGFGCECGCRFVMRLAFSRGATLMAVVDVREDCTPGRDLWRA